MENTESSGEFNLAAEADALIASKSEAGSESTESHSSDDGQAPAPSQKSKESEVSPEDVLNQLEKEPESIEDEKAIIDQINKIGAIHNGLPVQIESKKELVELIQKGFDYTKKTMAHAEEVKAKQDEFSKLEATYKEKESQLQQYESQLSNQVFENNIIESIVSRWKTEDPELFNLIAQEYQREVALYERNRPIQAKYDGELNNLKAEIQSLKGQKQSEEIGKIKSGWENELKEVQSQTAAQLAKLGVKPNWDRVKELWAADATGKMSVKQAMLAAHGEDILKANESYKKMLETKNKTQSKFVHRSGVGGGTKQQSKITAGSYEEFLKLAANET